MPLVSFKLIGLGSSPTLVRLSLTYVSPLGSWSVITTLFRMPFSMVLRKLIVYSIVSPSFGLALLTVFVAASLPAFASGTTGTSGSSGGLTVSSTLALLRIVSPALASSLTITLKRILRSFVSVILGYSAVIMPLASFKLVGFGASPTLVRLSLTYVNPFGSWSVITTLFRMPFSIVLRKLMVYSIASPSFGLALLTVFVAVSLPSFIRGVIGSSGVMGTSGSSGGLTVSSTLALLRIVSPALASSLTITLKRILRSFVSVILGYSAVIVPLVSFKLIGLGSSPTLVRLSLTYVSPLGSWSVITTLFRMPFSMVLRKLIVYSIVSPSFGLALLTVFVAASLPAFASGTTGTSGSSGGLTVSSTLALLRIVSPALASSLTITLKRILRSFVSVILGYSAVIVPLVSFKLIGLGSSPTLVRLSLTYVSPLGSWSVITTLFRMPFSMVLRKLIVYSIVSPSFGLALLTVFVAASLPAFASGTTGTSGSSGGLTVSSTLALLRIVSPALASSLTITLKRILRSFVSVILGYSAVIMPLVSFKLVGLGSSPTLVRLSLTYVSPFGSWSVITTLFKTPFSTVLRKLMVYSIVSPSFGLALLTVFVAVNLPVTCSSAIFASTILEVSLTFADVKISTASTVALLGTNSFAFARSFICALNS